MTCSNNKGLVLCIATLEDNFEPPSFRWEIEKPRNVDIHCWRRTQLTRYVNKYPSHKPKKILDQLEKHSPNPWPECNTKKLSRLINIVKRTRTLATCGSVKISSSSHLLVTDIQPKSLQWDSNMPSDLNVRFWRRVQLLRYVEQNSAHKPSKILAWINSHNPNPWPDCNTKKISRLINIIKNFKSYYSDTLSMKLSIQSCTTSLSVIPICRWEFERPSDTTLKEQRRRQIYQYHDHYPQHKPQQILNQMSGHKPHPWPNCNRNNINYLLNLVKAKVGVYNLKPSGALAQFKITPIQDAVVQETKKPDDCSEIIWRGIQVGRFLSFFPEAKPIVVCRWILSHTPNPWPGVDGKAIQKLIARRRNQTPVKPKGVGRRRSKLESERKIIRATKMKSI